jgi:hypothetical protein
MIVKGLFILFYKGPEGIKWELGFAFFGLGKWDLLHWDFNHWERDKTFWKWEWYFSS